MKIEKITTAMVEVRRAPVMSKNGLAGINSITNLANDIASTLERVDSRLFARAISAVPDVNPSAVRPKRFAIRIPTQAAIMVVTISTPSVRLLIFPNEVPPFSFRIAEMIDTITNGIMIICRRRT